MPEVKVDWKNLDKTPKMLNLMILDWWRLDLPISETHSNPLSSTLLGKLSKDLDNIELEEGLLSLNDQFSLSSIVKQVAQLGSQDRQAWPTEVVMLRQAETQVPWKRYPEPETQKVQRSCCLSRCYRALQAKSLPIKSCCL